MRIMEELLSALNTRTKIKLFLAIESGVSIQSVAYTLRLSVEEVKRIRFMTKADMKAITAFLQRSTVAQKEMMANLVRACCENELFSRRESQGVNQQTLRQWILAAEMGLLGEYYLTDPIKFTFTMSKDKNKQVCKNELDSYTNIIFQLF